ncbi:hypothetical protein JFT86_14130 [Pseudomonas sp. TH06]|uniref:hypothetical protein n=1 Tax=Pseudomonas sp. TH06 TaxID=2796372 RepID=UPI001913FA77|nr:hypothetical protein [Pseudomonas sp. TH06]MBK5528083.1 hypothetical protein [Pseudomonas sp. TH06]
MKAIKIAIPAIKNRSRIHFDKGRQWSEIEHLMLEALSHREYTVAEFENDAHIPKSVIIECLARLMRAGWIEITKSHPNIKFSATVVGSAAADRADLPSSVRRLNKNINFVIDEISGTTFKNHEIQFYDHGRMKNNAGIIRLKKPEDTPLYDQEELASMFLQDDEKLIGIDSIISRPFSGYAVFTVINGKIENQPSSMPKELETCIINAATSFASRTESSDTPLIADSSYAPPPANSPKSYNISFSNSDLLSGAESHRDYLTSVFKKSSSIIFIHSTFIRYECVKILLPEIKNASARGVKTFIYWGQEESSDCSTLMALDEIRKSLELEDISESVYISSRSTGSHAKIIISDSGHDGSFVSAIGSCNWLSSPFRSFEATALIKDATANKYAVSIFMKLIRNLHWDANINELLRISANLSDKEPPKHRQQNAKLSFITGSQHAALILKIRDSLKTDLLITSNKLSAASKPTIITPITAALQKNPNICINLLYGMTSGGFSKKEGLQMGMDLSNIGLSLTPVNKPGLHAKIISWDSDNLVISSLNWLSTTEIHENSLHEIGVLIESENIGKHFSDIVLNYQGSLV